MNKPVAAARSVLSKYATFSGRTSRAEFWWYILAAVIATIIANLIDGLIFGPLIYGHVPSGEQGQPISFLLSLAILLPSIAVAARRLHDTGRSGWWLLLGFIPVIGMLVLLYFYVQPGNEGPNQYGAPAPFPVA